MTMQTFTPVEYLMIDVANNFGLDQDNWDDRINWFKANEANLDERLKEAKEPALFYAGVQAYRAAQAGQSIAYPVSLDATSSGAQLLAVLIGCRQSASLCNVIDVGMRMDLYTSHFQTMCSLVDFPSTISRKDAKQAIMTAFYGSTKMPRVIFGEGELLDAFYKVMEEETPGIWELNKALMGLWQPNALSHDWVMPDNFHVHTKVMDEVVNAVTFMGNSYDIIRKANMATESGLSLPANVTHSCDGFGVREITRRCTFDPATKVRAMELVLTAPTHTVAQQVKPSSDTKMIRTLMTRYRASGFMTARVLDHLTAETIHLCSADEREAIWEMLESMPERPFPILSVHDCFRVHPNYANDLRKQYNRFLYEVAQSNILKDIASQIVGEEINVTKLGNFSAEILEANYALS